MSEIDRAQIYIDQFYRRQTDQLVSMRWAVTTGALQFVTGMAEKEIKTLGASLFSASFSIAVAAIPGGFFLTKAWKKLAQVRPIFADNLQYAVGVGIDASTKVYGAMSDVGDPQLFSAALVANLRHLYSKLNNGIAVLEAERTEVERRLVRFDEAGTPLVLGKIKSILGSLPPIMTGAQLDSLVTYYEYDLFRAHFNKNVRVIRVENTKRPTAHEIAGTKISYGVSGFNSGQLKYIYAQFGNGLMEDQLTKVVDAAAGAFRNAKDYKDFRGRLAKNVKDFDGLALIRAPIDLVDHWGAALAVEKIHYRHEPI